jgi:hypothetical protein
VGTSLYLSEQDETSVLVATIYHGWYCVLFSVRGDCTTEQFYLFMLSVDSLLLWGRVGFSSELTLGTKSDQHDEFGSIHAD